MDDKFENKDELRDFPLLKSLRPNPEGSGPPAAYFQNLQDRVMQQALAKGPRKVEDAPRATAGWVISAFVSLAAAVLLLILLRLPSANDAQSLDRLAASVSREELIASIDVREYDIELVANNMGSEAMAAVEESYHEEKIKLIEAPQESPSDSVLQNLDGEFLQDIDPSDLMNL